METQATARPWAYCKYGNFENESYVETWFAIVPEGQEPEDKYSEIQFEIARVGVALWRYQISHREVAPEEDEANAALIVRAVNHFDALVEALDRLYVHTSILRSELKPESRGLKMALDNAKAVRERAGRG